MVNARRYALALLCLALPAACAREPMALDRLDRATAVHAVLRAGTDTVRVLVSRVTLGASFGDLISVPVSGAVIRVVGPAGGVMLVEAAPDLGTCMPEVRFPVDGQLGATGEGCYAGVLPAAIAPGERYELQAVLPAGDTVRGAAVIPQPLVLVEPTGELRVALPTELTDSSEPTTIPVRWLRSADAARTTLGLRVAAPFVDGRAVPEAECGVGFSFGSSLGGDVSDVSESGSALYLTFARCFTFTGEGAERQATPLVWDSLSARLEVAAYDSAYDRYIEQVLAAGTVARDRAGAGLTGAVGVFAGTAITMRPVTLLPATP